MEILDIVRGFALFGVLAGNMSNVAHALGIYKEAGLYVTVETLPSAGKASRPS